MRNKIFGWSMVALMMWSCAASRSMAAPIEAMSEHERASLEADLTWMDEMSKQAEDQELDGPLPRIWPVCRRGSSKPSATRAVQYLLRAHGLTVAVDGNFGTQTQNRVRQFQAEDMDVTGVVDDWTWEALVIKVQRGSRGPAVNGVQSLLRSRGYKLPLDGVFGVQTERAVRAFQKKNGLTVDGRVGPFTWCKLVGGQLREGG